DESRVRLAELSCVSLSRQPSRLYPVRPRADIRPTPAFQLISNLKKKPSQTSAMRTSTSWTHYKRVHAVSRGQSTRHGLTSQRLSRYRRRKHAAIPTTITE